MRMIHAPFSQFGAGRVGVDALNDHNDDNIETQIGRHIKPQPDGCWLWNGEDNDRYPQNKTIGSAVHRYVYEILVGPIPEGHQLHHTCERKSCCNPYHLEPLTPSEHKLEHLARKR